MCALAYAHIIPLISFFLKIMSYIHFSVCRYGGGSGVVQIDEVSFQISGFLQRATSILQLGGFLRD